MDGAASSRVSALPTPPPNESYDRVPPHNLDAEISVLGSMLLDKNAIAEVTELIGPEDFYRGAHRTLFEAMQDLYDRGEPVDAVTLADDLQRRGKLSDIGGSLAIADILAKVPTSANALHYARIVSGHALRRRLIDTGTQITKLGYDDTEGPEEVVDAAEQMIYKVAQFGRVSEFTPMKQLVNEGFALIEKLYENKSAITGLATGFTDFDELTAGLQPANLVILAARPAMGKCLAASSLVFDASTGARRRIGDLVEDEGRGDGIEVAALGSDHRFHAVPVSAFHDNGVKPVFRLRTRLGREIVATENHPFLTMGGWTALEKLAPGSRIATPRALPFFGSETVPDAEVALLAYLIGGGSLGERTPRFTTASAVLLADLTTHAEAAGVRVRALGADTFQYSLATDREVPNPLAERLRFHNLAGTRSSTKCVPEAIMSSSRRQIALFLNRLFACDGSVYCNDQYAQVTYTTISERLARDVQHLLLRFGILAKLRGLKRPIYDGTGKKAWELQITDPQGVRTFAAEIGILGKDDRLAKAVALFDSRPGSSPNRDLVPAEVWDRIIEVRGTRTWRQLSAATGRPPNHKWHVGKRSPSRKLLAEIEQAWPDEELRNLADSDIYWDEVISIDPAGQERVYDLTVPGDHNFVASDLVVHNSTLVVNMATHVAVEQRKPAVLFSLEMSQMELVQRVLAAEARVDSDRLRTGRLQESDWPKLSQAMGRLAEAPLFIDDTPGINLMEIRSKCRRLKQQHGLELIIVDYLQLMQSHKKVENRVQEVSELSRGLKILAKELSVPVVALSQLSRRPEDRNDKRPQLSDLRESGCLTADARVLRADTGAEVTMGELYASGERNIPVWTVDHDYKIVRGTMSHVFSTGVKETFRLRLASGRDITASANHPFLTYSGWTRLDELEVGTRMAVPRAIPEPASTTVWDDHEVILLAHLLGDGCFAPRQPIHYTSNDLANIEVVEEAARHFGITPRRVQQQTWWHTYLPSPYKLGHGKRSPLSRWLDDLGGLYGKRSHEKFIPAEVFSLKKPQVALFLRHLWATDGHLGRRGRTVTCYYASSSRRLVDDIQQLLLRFGIPSRLRTVSKEGYGQSYQLWLSGKASVRRFLQDIGVHGTRGEKADELLAFLETVHANPSSDTVPADVWDLVRDEMQHRGMTHRDFAVAMGTAYCGSTLYKHSPSRQRLAKAADVVGSPGARLLAESDLYWDEVASIEPLGSQEVFDATVPGTHNFIAMNIIVENSIEQDADVVCFIYRDEVYSPDTAAKGEAELIVSKHRNGPLSTIHLAFLGSTSRFANLRRGPGAGGPTPPGAPPGPPPGGPL